MPMDLSVKIINLAFLFKVGVVFAFLTGPFTPYNYDLFFWTFTIVICYLSGYFSNSYFRSDQD